MAENGSRRHPGENGQAPENGKGAAASSGAAESAESAGPSPAVKDSRLTRLLHAGRGFDPTRHAEGPVNPPVIRASTILVPDVETLETRAPYGTKGTETTRALEEALLAIESAAACFLYPSGLAAIAGALLALTRSGDHVLLSDALYYPTRRLMNELMAGYGVSVSYFDPRAATEEIIAAMRPETRVLFLESPGSDTLEVLDVPALAAAARARGIVTVIDNTWSAGWLFDPFAHGCDVSVQALTKYQAGHADVLMGAVLCREELAGRIRATTLMLGQCVSGDEAWLVLRGLRTLPLRLQAQGRNALQVARWLAEQPEVAAVLHPALPGAHGHEIWKRDFRGASSLFSFVLDARYDETAARAMIDGLRLFGIGASWGGYESLVMLKDIRRLRTTPFPHEGWLVRLSIGLETPEDLIADLRAGLDRLHAAGKAR
jgi:cystathionine beta-lyase